MKLGRGVLPNGLDVVLAIGASTARPVGVFESTDSILTALAGGALTPVEGASDIPIDQVQLLPPVSPPSIRDFVAFESHLKNIGLASGKPVPPEWYESPAFYFSNAGAIFGQDAAIQLPRGSEQLDFEVELACVVGRDASNLDADDPATLDVIAGFCIFNDFSARDLQARDSAVGVGPTKGKDFANAFGPWIVSPDELGGIAGGRVSCAMSATVNGEVWTSTSTSEMYYTWGEILAAASANTTIRRGDLIGAGTCPRGCIAELRNLQDGVRWLAVGDVVEVWAEGIGTLRNSIV